MQNRLRWIMLVMVVAVGLATGGAGAQGASLIPPFPDTVIRLIENGDLKASYKHDGDILVIKVQTKGGAPEKGWGGACVENKTSVDLRNFSHARAVIDASAKIRMDIKIEKARSNEGTILLVDQGDIVKGEQTLEWVLRNASEVVGSGTMSQARRMCFFVLADYFPNVQEVTVKLRGIRFDKK